jgi:hypothetical protein
MIDRTHWRDAFDEIVPNGPESEVPINCGGEGPAINQWPRPDI